MMTICGSHRHPPPPPSYIWQLPIPSLLGSPTGSKAFIFLKGKVPLEGSLNATWPLTGCGTLSITFNPTGLRALGCSWTWPCPTLPGVSRIVTAALASAGFRPLPNPSLVDAGTLGTSVPRCGFQGALGKGLPNESVILISEWCGLAK